MDKGMLVLFLKMAISLAAVLSIFAGVVFLFRKFSGTSRGFLKRTGAVAKPLEVLAFQSLGPGRSVYLMRCQGKKVLIGATNTHISHLGDIDDEDDDDESSDSGFDSLVNEQVSGKPEQSLKKQISASLREISRV